MENNFHLWKPPFDDESVAKAKSKVLNRIHSESQYTTYGKSYKTQIRFAAAVLAMVVMGSIIYLFNKVEVTNTNNDIKIVVLPDASKIKLASGATVTYNKLSWHWKRSIHFKGVGHFEITSGKEFIVHLNNATVQVLGTSFTIWTNSRSTFIHCTEGRIKIAQNSQEIILKKFEFTTVYDEEISPKDVYSTVEFIVPRNESTLSFTSVPLEIVMKELEVKMNIRIKNHLPKGLTYTGTVDTANVNDSFEILCKPFGASFQIQPNGDVWIFPQ